MLLPPHNAEPKKVYEKRFDFYKESAHVFRSVHALEDEADSIVLALDSEDSEVVSVFHSSAKAYTNTLYKYLDQLKHEKGKEALKERDLYHCITAVWHLCEVIYFPHSTDTSRSPDLMQWLNRINARALLRFDNQGIFHCHSPLTHREFWPFMYKLLIFGQHSTLTQLIISAKLQVSDPILVQLFESLASLVQDMPTTPKKLNGSEALLFKDKREHWQTQLEKAVDNLPQCDYATQFRDCILILSGKDSAIYEHTENVGEVLVAALYYTYPLATLDDIHKLADLLRGCYVLNDDWLGICMDLLAGDLYVALRKCAQLDWWLLAHFTDLLSLTETANIMDAPLQLCMNEQTNASEVEPRVFFVVNYAACLIDQEDLSRFAFDYMSTCGEMGMTYLRKSLKQLSLKSEKHIVDLLDRCSHYGLEDEQKRIYETAASEAVECKDYPTAVRYHCLNDNYTDIDRVFELAMENYAMTGKLVSMEGLKPEVRQACIRQCTRASFYFDFYHFQARYNLRHYEVAAQLLSNLLSEERTPDHLVPIVFLESVALLEDPEWRFDKKSVHLFEKKLQGIRESGDAMKWDILRMYLARKGVEVVDAKLIDSFFGLMSLILSRTEDRLRTVK